MCDIIDNNNIQIKKRGRPKKYDSDDERKEAIKKIVKERNKLLYNTNEEFRNKAKSHYIKKDILDWKHKGKKSTQEKDNIEIKKDLLHDLRNMALKILRINKEKHIIDNNIETSISNLINIIN